MNRVYFRIEGGETIGLGHLYRTLALAEMLDGIVSNFILTSGQKHLEDLIDHQFERTIIPELPNEADEADEANYLAESVLPHRSVIIIDGYGFDHDYRQRIAQQGHILVYIDDLISGRYCDDLVINHAPGIEETVYQRAYSTRILSGIEYVILRPAFLLAARRDSFEKKDGSVLISMGGSDSGNVSLKILQELTDSANNLPKEIIVVVGSANPHKQVLKEFANANSAAISIVSNLGEEAMAALMERSSYAICSPSTTSLEYLCFGGKLFLLQTADNQKYIYSYLLEKGMAEPYHASIDLSPSNSGEERKLQPKSIDGQSSSRIKKAIEHLISESRCTIRSADLNDAKLLFNWANHPETRKYAFSKEPIPWENHLGWFKEKLQSPLSFIFIISDGDKEVAQVRFDKEGEAARISYSVSPDQFGNGYGYTCLKLALKEAIKKSISPVYFGEVQSPNKPSIRIFQKLNFESHFNESTEVYTFKLQP